MEFEKIEFGIRLKSTVFFTIIMVLMAWFCFDQAQNNTESLRILHAFDLTPSQANIFFWGCFVFMGLISLLGAYQIGSALFGDAKFIEITRETIKLPPYGIYKERIIHFLTVQKTLEIKTRGAVFLEIICSNQKPITLTDRLFKNKNDYLRFKQILAERSPAIRLQEQLRQ